MRTSPQVAIVYCWCRSYFINLIKGLAYHSLSSGSQCVCVCTTLSCLCSGTRISQTKKVARSGCATPTAMKHPWRAVAMQQHWGEPQQQHAQKTMTSVCDWTNNSNYSSLRAAPGITLAADNIRGHLQNSNTWSYADCSHDLDITEPRLCSR